MTEISVGLERDYIYYENYISDEDRLKLLAYFTKNITRVNQSTNQNSAYNGRLIYYESVDDSEIKELMRNIHDSVAQRLMQFYGETTQIYPEATHIVKWPQGTRLNDHADNAYADGTPNYVPWRSHSAVLYLNEDFEGGEFYFKKEATDIKPKNGLLIAFKGGMSHVHGVRVVKKGTRMALPMWFTQEKRRAYPEYR